MDEQFLAETEIFRGISSEEIWEMLSCLKPQIKKYKKGEAVCRTGDRTGAMGLVLSGGVHVESGDVWGNTGILDRIGQGQVFAEACACVPGEPMMVDVTAVSDTRILFLDIGRVLRTCPLACSFHSRLIENLLRVLALKNLNLTRKISYITPKSIRERLLTYLSDQSVRQGSFSFEIPFNRQQLAEYLGVDRSALSAEMSRMRREGLISFHKNQFRLENCTDGKNQ